MKYFIKRAVLILLGAIVGALFLVLVGYSAIETKHTYKYLNFENEWGESNNCYFQEGQVLVCEVENSLVKVSQYYEKQ